MAPPTGRRCRSGQSGGSARLPGSFGGPPTQPAGTLEKRAHLAGSLIVTTTINRDDHCAKPLKPVGSYPLPGLLASGLDRPRHLSAAIKVPVGRMNMISFPCARPTTCTSGASANWLAVGLFGRRGPA